MTSLALPPPARSAHLAPAPISIRATCLVLAGTALFGCATPTPLQTARPALSESQKHALAQSDVVSRTDLMTQHLNDAKSVVYFQNHGGGGAGLGILLGPLGVAANMKMIEAVTTGDVTKLKGKVVLNPEAAFQRAAAAESFAIHTSANQGDVKVTPFVLISKTDEAIVHVSSLVLFEGEEGPNKWTRRYQYQLPGNYALDELAAFTEAKSSELQSTCVMAYASLLKHIAAESNETIALERKITFKSAYISPRFSFELVGSLIGAREGMVWVRTAGAVSAVHPSNIQYQVVKN